MSNNQFHADEALSISVEREDDESGLIVLTISANNDVITIYTGRFQEDADQLRGELEGATDQARTIHDDWEDQPDNERDGFVSDGRDGYDVSLEGSHIGTYKSHDIAVYELASAMAAGGIFPNAWSVNERGNTDAIHDQVGAWLDEGKLKPAPGAKYGRGADVRVSDEDWQHWVVDADYGDMGVVVHTYGDPSVNMLASHDRLQPYEDDEEDEGIPYRDEEINPW